MAPTLLFCAAFYLAPLLELLQLSVTEPHPGLGNYALLWDSAPIQRALLTTLRLGTVTTLVAVALGYLLAYAILGAPERQARLMLFCVLLPFWLSVLARAFAWVMLLRREGMVNALLLGSGLVSEPLALVRNETGVLIGMVHYMVPYAVLPLLANMRGIDRRHVAAARGLGAGPFTAFRRVFLPQTLPGLVTAAVLVFVFSLGFYVTPAILGGGRTMMIAELIAWNVQELLRWGVAAMLATSLLLTVGLAIGAASRWVDPRRLLGAS
ncbi:ABC transporter permease [Roseomonas sp. OT10]|uniref:ABC transporter permease n=1 Tax=Roseomonas cutis TaxID=2897332 RepID=UPI001E54F6FC|nr:ABC transporter permease [Roseomonas sp. OT10]UFN48516.1 ABC transporter permease [Roseomonas sp. OT10]